MNVFNSFLLYPPTVVHPEGPMLQWSLDPVFNEPVPYNFTLEISEEPTFSSLIFSKNVGDSTYTIDDSGLHKNISDDYIYRVKLETRVGNIYYSRSLKIGATKEERSKYLKAQEIVRKELLRIRKYTGFKAYLLKRKNFGPRAVDVDEVSGVPLADNPTDFGTGIDGGYYPAISLMISRERYSKGRSFKQEGFGVEENAELVYRAVGFPNIEPRDIIVDRNTGDRFNVLACTAVFFPGTELQIIQNIQARLIAPTDQIYKIPVP